MEDLDAFWASIWEFFGVGARPPPGGMLADASMPGARWCRDATLNYAEHALRPGPDSAVRVAMVAHSQTRAPITWTMEELRDHGGRARRGLQRLGVGPGDRVVAYLPNIPEALVAFLAAASLGAVWSSCAPEFGTRSVIDRFSQVSPSVLLCVDGYRYGATSVDRTADTAVIRQALPSLSATVTVPYLVEADGGDGWPGAEGAAEGVVPWAWLVGEPSALEFTPVPFDHPLYVLYSSGTTGLPKAIVHGHGGILLEHLKALALLADLGAGDRFFWFTTTGWMMWNLLVSGLLVDSAVVLFDGNPGYPDLSALWRLAEATGTTYFGVSAPFLMACRKAGVVPSSVARLGAIRGVGSTGAPLPGDGFRWVYSAVGTDLLLASMSGGTDVCTAFVGGCPLVPVYAGEISCRYLGVAVEAFDTAGGRCAVGEQGELVVTRPMPSMPVAFWGDADGTRYHSAYFEDYRGVWRHGDWITFTSRGTCVISGRSDATLNRGGVRVGTAEFYSVVESLPEVVDSLVVHLEDPDGGPGELLLFVVLAAGVQLDDELRARLQADIRSNLSPRHGPDRIHAVPAIPRTLSGKKLEVPVKRILAGTPADEAVSRGALANPDALLPFEELAAGLNRRELHRPGVRGWFPPRH